MVPAFEHEKMALSTLYSRTIPLRSSRKTWSLATGGGSGVGKNYCCNHGKKYKKESSADRERRSQF